MSRPAIETASRRRRAIAASLLAAGVALPSPLLAQDALGLRGGLVAQDAARRDAAPPTADIPPTDYLPASEGAIPDTTLAADDPFAEPPVDPAPRTRRAGAAATDETTTGTVRVETVDEENDVSLDEGAERVEAIEDPDRTTPEDRPFDAPGIRYGSFVLKPTLEQGVTYSSNAESVAGGDDATLSETVLRVNLASEWEANAVTVDAYGIFRKTISGEDVEDLRGGIDGALTLDLGNEYRLRAGAGYSIVPTSASSPVAIPGADEQPYQQTITGSLGLDKDVGKARFGVTGRVERDLYGEAQLFDGVTLSQEDRDSTLYAVTLRTGYEISPALTPFLEGEIGRRDYDLEADASGYRRSSDRVGARAGVTIDLGEKFGGEILAGWIRESFEDDRLKPIEGPTVAGELRWSPERGTNVGLSGSTIVEGTTSAGESGSLLYGGRLSVEREIRANLTGTASAGLAYRDYTSIDQNDVIFDADASLTWWLNRYAGITGRVRHEQVDSTIDGRDSETNSVFLGIRLQR